MFACHKVSADHRKFFTQIQECCANLEHLKHVTKIECRGGNPQTLNHGGKRIVQYAVVQINEEHKKLMEFFRPYLDPAVVKKIFYEDEIAILKQENGEINLEKELLRREILELWKKNEERQQNFEQLQKRCQELEQQHQICEKRNSEITSKFQQQQERELTFEAPTNLPIDPEHRPSDSGRETKILRKCNKSLVIETRKTNSTAQQKTAMKPTVSQEKTAMDNKTNMQLLSVVDVEQEEHTEVQNYHVAAILQSISKIKINLDKLVHRGDRCCRQKVDKEYRSIQTCLLRNLLKLDKIQTTNNQLIDVQRKVATNQILQLLNQLQSKFAS